MHSSFKWLAAAWLAVVTATAFAQPPSLDLSQYRGKVVYLDFWASWCKPCRHSFPWMNSMQQKYAADGLVVVSVDLDEERADADRFLKDVPASFPVIFDPDGTLAEKYDLVGMPTSFLIDRNGNIYKKHAGFYDNSPAEYEDEIRGLLGK